MTPEEKLEAYEKMQGYVAAEYAALSEKLEALKAADKTRTVTYREGIGKRMYYKSLLELYQKFGL